MKIELWLNSAIKSLDANGVDNPRLDCLVLLESVLNKDRSRILAHLDDSLSRIQTFRLNLLLKQRLDRKPLAYILKNKEFYNNNFFVNKHVLIPRPESEDIIEIFSKLKVEDNARIADIGTGSGILAITISKLYPLLDVHAYDIDSHALKVARKNVKQHGSKVKLGKSILLMNASGPYQVIVANLPYVAHSKAVSKEVKHEPKIALYSNNNGRELIYELINQINTDNLNPGGFLILEADIEQHKSIVEQASQHNLKHLDTKNLILLFKYNRTD